MSSAAAEQGAEVLKRYLEAMPNSDLAGAIDGYLSGVQSNDLRWISLFEERDRVLGERLLICLGGEENSSFDKRGLRDINLRAIKTKARGSVDVEQIFCGNKEPETVANSLRLRQKVSPEIVSGRLIWRAQLN